MVDMTSACLESTTSLNEPTRKFSLQRCFIAWLHFLRQSRLRRKLEQEKLVSNEQIARFAASFKEQKQRPFSYPFTLLSSGNSTGELRPASVPAVGNRSRGNNTASSIDKNFQRFQERAAERKHRLETLQKKKDEQQLEATEAKRVAEREAKQTAARERKKQADLRKQRLAAEVLRKEQGKEAQEKRRMKEFVADQHRKNCLMKIYGIDPWIRLTELKRERDEAARQFQWTLRVRNAFARWRNFCSEITSEKLRFFVDMLNRFRLRMTFIQFRKLKSLQDLQMQQLVPTMNLLKLEHYFTRWKSMTTDTQIERLATTKLFMEKLSRFSMDLCFNKWKSLPHVCARKRIYYGYMSHLNATLAKTIPDFCLPKDLQVDGGTKMRPASVSSNGAV